MNACISGQASNGASQRITAKRQSHRYACECAPHVTRKSYSDSMTTQGQGR